jgi:hypothetical protein
MVPINFFVADQSFEGGRAVFSRRWLYFGFEQGVHDKRLSDGGDMDVGGNVSVRVRFQVDGSVGGDFKGFKAEGVSAAGRYNIPGVDQDAAAIDQKLEIKGSSLPLTHSNP